MPLLFGERDHLVLTFVQETLVFQGGKHCGDYYCYYYYYYF